MASTATFPTVLRELLRTHQAFLAYAASHVHTLDLTLPQYDILITLGDTAGMSFKKLGEKTLITKGTLTGVISRLEDKGLVQRAASKTDGRSQIVQLSAAGGDLYQRSYPEHLAFINRIFTDYAPEEVGNLEAALRRLQQTVSTLRSEGHGKPADEADE
ncbi:MAG: MarR family transcriptional regulator [Methylobacter sp.]|nr:MarR family transcriptional regulator [Methylobacter sp.]MDP2098331.1 MarR family transcriptional regulator [Methylobacter sp.]MDP2430189.1 MarR family transcriptional regulator [Methylobacter sp.]MDP3056373.1 MarR family transcriptional regulator [Methylobacter sp.]MDP3362874.1 MarR family transcriptional regulator [Methylobacter sp.]